jgi:hypothetical protein
MKVDAAIYSCCGKILLLPVGLCLADWQSAIQQAGSLRYFVKISIREVCGTELAAVKPKYGWRNSFVSFSDSCEAATESRHKELLSNI